MTVDEDIKHPLAKFENTILVEIKPGESTLPIETAAEWSKGFMLINKVISEIVKDTFIEDYIDEAGDERRSTHIHPQLLSFLQERRRLQDQIWKFVGGEAVVEGKKQAMRNMADIIFGLGKNAKMREEKKEEIKKMIEVEFTNE